jgi:flagellin-like hook-associated protein FlgL
MMQINTNNYALNTARRMAENTNALQQSLQRLSSGLRINGAKDDAAGMAIADRMTTQIRGNNQAIRNVQDGTSMLQTAEGALSTVNDALQRVRELSIQAANATNTSSDRQALQSEVNQLLAEIDRVGATTSFNGRQIFSQIEDSISGDSDQRAVMDGLSLGWLENSENRIRKFYGISGDGAKLDVQLTDFTDGAGGTAARVVGSFAGYTGKGSDLKLQIDMADFTPADLPDGGTAPFYNDRVILHEMVHAVMYRSMNMGSLFNPTDSLSSRWFAEGMSEFIHGADERLTTDIAATSAQTATLTGTGGTATRDLSVSGASQFTLEYKGSDFNIDLTGETFSGTSGNAATQSEILTALQNKIDAIGTLKGKITVSAAAGNNLTLTTTDTGLDISLEIKQAGANTGHTVLFGGAIAQVNGTGGAQEIVNNIADGAGTKTWSLDSAHYSSAISIRNSRTRVPQVVSRSS